MKKGRADPLPRLSIEHSREGERGEGECVRGSGCSGFEGRLERERADRGGGGGAGRPRGL